MQQDISKLLQASVSKRDYVQSRWYIMISILMQMTLITRKVLPLASFWKWGFLEFKNGLLNGNSPKQNRLVTEILIMRLFLSPVI